jgi:hypothetical protein
VSYLCFGVEAKASVQLRCTGYFWHYSGHPALRRYAASSAVRAAPAAQCPKVTKRLGARRGVLIRFRRIRMPCASRLRRGRLTAHPCAGIRRARVVRAPLRAFSATACDARHRERRHWFHEPVHPWTALLWTAVLILVPVCRGEGATDQSARMTRRMRVSSRTYMDVRQANPGVTSRTRTASPCERGIRGGVFLVTFSSLLKKK